MRTALLVAAAVLFGVAAVLAGWPAGILVGGLCLLAVALAL